MHIIKSVLLALIALQHLYVLWIEMFAWETRGKIAFKEVFREELFAPTKAFAANQGLYNGFLAAGIVWTFFITDQQWKFNIAVFFLCCVITAGIFGALTSTRKIFFFQALPAILTLLIVLIEKYN